MSTPESARPAAVARRARRAVAALSVGLAAVVAVAQDAPRLGVEATEAEVSGWALSVLPDGTGLPAGSGTAADGADVYRRSCIACHGVEGQGGPNDQLVGGHGTIASEAPVRTVGSYWPYATTVFDYIRRAMPFTAPQSLSDDEVYAVTAYLLALNDIIDEDFVVDASTLPGIEMPNAGNFFWDYTVDQ